jgi:lipopolysaccharide/colanic/teichoic acid biosynthesis glycosyltransferase
VGRLLRKTSIDELPQLWNVLIGEMSLVGPRPLVADEQSHFQGNVLALLSTRPGLTGAWAVSGRHGVSYPKRAEIELRYVRRLSIRQDLVILVRTVAAVINPGAGPTGSRQGE